ncbi:MAG: lipoyl(octanoyl) transferase LipB [Candidatus Neomarinimicrobiota bacterium]|nr:MAG: lipoyl(octanoyl) transferase LipB [Candidatus Neomarinimicrobiota bacterium]
MTVLSPNNEEVTVRDLGHRSYQTTWDLQKELQQKVISGEMGDQLLLVEHEPVYTLGKNADRSHILSTHPAGISIFEIERGGDVTYHGPGQLVVYPILDLHRYRTSVSWYMRTLEEVIIQTLARFGIVGDRKTGLTGVWVGDEKIAALGVRMSRWVTMHGLALNVDPDLRYFQGIIPCGIREYGVTSMARLLEPCPSLKEVKEVLMEVFAQRFHVRLKRKP